MHKYQYTNENGKKKGEKTNIKIVIYLNKHIHTIYNEDGLHRTTKQK